MKERGIGEEEECGVGASSGIQKKVGEVNQIGVVKKWTFLLAEKLVHQNS